MSVGTLVLYCCLSKIYIQYICPHINGLKVTAYWCYICKLVVNGWFSQQPFGPQSYLCVFRKFLLHLSLVLPHDDVVIFYISFANLPSLHTSRGKFGFSKHGYLFYLNEALIHSDCVIKTMHTTEWHFI